ncbi:MAG: DUF3102 domain-containing protein, partial [Selenomonadaceae bacterium]|nr:DUF3102 domain-containing protein [Selenomonadaceae bacterium]
MLKKRNVSEVDRRAERIRRLQADVQTRVIAIGFELLAAKKEIGHGGWANWLRTQFSWSERTARNFMNIAARFGNRQVFSTLQPSTLIELLALPKGDEEPFIEAQAEAGEPVESLSARQVKQKVDQWRDAKDADEKKPRLTYCTGNPEWYTPSKYIDAAR